MVQRTNVRGISKQGRSAQGVRVMNLREDDVVSAVALVVETSTDTSAVVDEGIEEPVAEIEDFLAEVEDSEDGGEDSEDVLED